MKNEPTHVTQGASPLQEMRIAADYLFAGLSCAKKGLDVTLSGGHPAADGTVTILISTEGEGIAQHVEAAPGSLEQDWVLADTLVAGRSVARVSIYYHCNDLHTFERLCALAHRLCLEYRVPAIFCVRNPLRSERIPALFADIISGSTEQLDALAGRGTPLLNGKTFTRTLQQSGFHEVARGDIASAPLDSRDDAAMLSNALIGRFLTYIVQLSNQDAQIACFVRAFLAVNALEDPLPVEREEAEAPFLSIITRTQGKRIEALQEMLLCLSAQSCTDFELLVMAHKTKSETLAAVATLIDDLPAWMRDRTRLIAVNHGNRSTPLNEGMRHARGRYISILDDDDLVFDNWVEAFHQAPKYGPILHSYAVSQDWSSVTDARGNTTLSAAGPMGGQYCCDFNLIEQMLSNKCPLHSLSFPSYLYTLLGMRFDETLDTTEDWDFLMRSSLLCGVQDIREVTCIYRLWVDHENSHSLHDDDEWENNRIRIQKRLSKSMLLVENGGRDFYRLHAEVKRLESLCGLESPCGGRMDGQSRLYLNLGQGFTQESSLELVNKAILPHFEYVLGDLADMPTIRAIRWDPQNDGLLFLDYLDVTIGYPDSPPTRLTLQMVRSNGVSKDGLMGFLYSDPQVLLLDKNNRPISQIIIRGHLRSDIDDATLRAMMYKATRPMHFFKAFYRRAGSFIRRALRRILNRG